MKTPDCPNCFKPPKISFKSRLILPTKKGIPCNNCQTLLIPPIWEGLVVFVPVFLIPHLYFRENLWLFSISFLILAGTLLYLSAVFTPLKIKSELKENKWLFVLIVFISIPVIYWILFLMHSA